MVIPQLLLIRLINTQRKQEATHAFSPALHLPFLCLFGMALREQRHFEKVRLLAALQSRFSSAHNSLSKGRGGGKENP